MASTDFGYVVAVNGLSVLRDLETLPQQVITNAQRAVNYSVRRTRTRSADLIRQQVNFPASYLSDAGGRLTVSKYASGNDLEARITARFRPTSLARFVTSGSVNSPKAGVSLRVAPGVARRSKRMFLMRLRAGKADIDTQSNLGLAIRLKPGERIDHKYQMVPIGKGLYLLYGPSISQVFQTVSDDVSPAALDFMETEFTRLMGLDL